MKLEEAIRELNFQKEYLGETYPDKRLKQAIETILKELKDRDKEITDMREMIVRVAKSLEKRGKYELSEYILAQIEATPTFTTWEEYTTWISKKKIEDKIEEVIKLINEEQFKVIMGDTTICNRIKHILKKELLEED